MFSTVAPIVPNMEQEDTSKAQYRVLGNDIIERIKKDFKSVDFNKDGRISSDELKALLQKYDNVFTESEVLEISELFYVGNAGRPIPFENLIQAIDDTLSTKGGHDKKNSLKVGSCAAEYLYDLNHHQWKEEDLNIDLTHKNPDSFTDKLAYGAVKAVRLGFDTATGWNKEITTRKVLQRVIYLETIAAVPGMVAAIVRHFKSLRTMTRDGGLINMFLEEATNERMHLLTFVRMRDPTLAFRAAVIAGQFGFGSGFLMAYLINPRFCHRFVGYVEEEACSTYTKIIEAIEKAPEGTELAEWRTQKAPDIGISYWHLGENGTVLDLMKAVRADEAEHRDVNHSVCDLAPGQINPRYDPAVRVDMALNKYVREMMTRAPQSS
jgi:hypothetical protein